MQIVQINVQMPEVTSQGKCIISKPKTTTLKNNSRWKMQMFQTTVQTTPPQISIIKTYTKLRNKYRAKSRPLAAVRSPNNLTSRGPEIPS